MKYILAFQLVLLLCAVLLTSYNLLYARGLQKTKRDTGIAPTALIKTFVKLNIWLSLSTGILLAIFIAATVMSP